MSIIATIGQLFVTIPPTLPVDIAISAQRNSASEVVFTFDASIASTRTVSVTANLNMLNINGSGTSQIVPVIISAGSLTGQAVITRTDTIIGQYNVNTLPLTITTGFAFGNITSQINVPAFVDTSVDIRPMFVDRTLANRIRYSYTLSLDAINPNAVTANITANNIQNRGANNNNTATLPGNTELTTSTEQVSNVSGSGAYQATFTLNSVTTGFTGNLAPTSIDIPAYIPPITPLDFNARVNFVHSFPDGKLLCVGRFTQYGTTAANAIIKLNADGTVDTSFVYGTGFATDSTPLAVNSVTVQSDGRIICLGRFNSYNGTAAQSIIRLNANGSVDTTFSYGTGFRIGTTTTNTDVAVILSDGRIAVGGNFTRYNGVTRNSIAILNSNGSLDTTFDPGDGLMRGNDSIGVRTIELEPGTDRLFVGGDFDQARGVSRNRIAKFNLNGTLDTTFVIGTGFSLGHATNAVYDIVHHDGKYYVGGQFGRYDGNIANRIVRLNPNGSVDTTFNTGTAFQDTAGSVLVMAIDMMGDIYCGGSFVQYQGVSANRIIKLSSSGSRDTSFVVGTGFDNSVFGLNFEASGVLLCSGDFNTYKGTNVGEITRLNQSGNAL